VKRSGFRRELARIGVVALACIMSATFGPNDTLAEPSRRLLRTLEMAALDEDVYDLRISFTEPVRYLSHAPATEGRILRIRLQSRTQMMRSSSAEALRISREQSALVRDVRFDPLMRGAGEFLVIEFVKPVRFAVEQTDDLEEIRVRAVESTTSVGLVESERPRRRATAVPSGVAAAALRSTRAEALAPRISAAAARRAPAFSSFAAEAEPSAAPAAGLSFSAAAERDLPDPVSARPSFAAPSFSASARSAPSFSASAPQASSFSAAAESRARAAFSSAARPAPAVAEAPALFAATARRRSAKPTGDLIADGRTAMTDGDTERAILLFTAVLEDEENPRAEEARELLGLAHQRNGQLAHAKAEYEAYLAQWPDGDGAARVQQRLDQLLTATEEPQTEETFAALALAPQRIPEAAARSRSSGRQISATSRPPIGFLGFRSESTVTVAQAYRVLSLDTDRTGRETALSSVDADIFVNTRHTRDDWTIRTSFTGQHRRGLAGTRDRPGDDDNEFRLSSGFVEARKGTSDLLARFGRQSARGSGILGRYDGLFLSKGIGEGNAINFVGGFPVDFADQDGVNTDRPFLGASFDIGPTFQYFSGQVFGIQQRVDGIEDRTAIGTELRFTHPLGTALALVDYDVGFDEFGLLTFVGNARLDDATTLNAFIDVRKSPFLTAFNAIQGQGVDSIDDLRAGLSESQIRDLAEARTAEARMFTLGLSRQMNDRLMLSADVTLTNLGDTDPVGQTPFAPAMLQTPGSDDELLYTVQANVSDFFLDSSYTTVALRLADGRNTQRKGIILGGRYPLTERLRVMPELTVERREFDNLGDQLVTRPALRFEMQFAKLRLDLELGYEQRSGDPFEQESFYSNIGYQYQF
jgi:hypothetical protein